MLASNDLFLAQCFRLIANQRRLNKNFQTLCRARSLKHLFKFNLSSIQAYLLEEDWGNLAIIAKVAIKR